TFAFENNLFVKKSQFEVQIFEFKEKRKKISSPPTRISGSRHECMSLYFHTVQVLTTVMTFILAVLQD
ncbi:hypothetical protein T06_14803, partial [Trichinella sp. T6]